MQQKGVYEKVIQSKNKIPLELCCLSQNGCYEIWKRSNGGYIFALKDSICIEKVSVDLMLTLY